MKEYHTELADGDVLLFATDGFEELFNEQREMLGLSRVKALFEEHATRSPEAIIDRLCQKIDSWRGQQEQKDDITFVVLKKRSS